MEAIMAETKPSTRCLVAGLGAVLTLIVVILNIGGLKLLSRVILDLPVTLEGLMIFSIPATACLVGYSLTRLNIWWILISGVLIGLLGAWGITLYAISQV